MGENEKKELIELRIIKKEFINKMLIFGILVLAVIIAASIGGIIVANAYNKKVLAEYLEKTENQTEEEKKEEEEEEIVENNNEQKDEKIPIYSEDAKNRMSNIYKKEGEEKIAYLTFDDGPSSNITPQILQILQDEGIKATFFVLGSRVELYPDLVKQEYEAGHYIANHGYSHDYPSVYASSNAVLDEYNRTENAIKQAIGKEEYSSHLFRFPGGSGGGGKYANVKDEAKILLEENNIAYINWNSLTNDAVGKPTAESIVNDLKSTSERKK